MPWVFCPKAKLKHAPLMILTIAAIFAKYLSHIITSTPCVSTYIINLKKSRLFISLNMFIAIRVTNKSMLIRMQHLVMDNP